MREPYQTNGPRLGKGELFIKKLGPPPWEMKKEGTVR
jgi:hypothetical protein